ncbi:MAG TPA: LytR family transcriptional regulator, partial [Corynebacterium sp.]|nr:LytR family transcriptional regulator [Corynebacterium sp.]
MDDREHRRRPDPSRRPLGRSSDPRDSDDFVLGRDGKPLVDRYGRPVRRRPQRPPRREPQRPPRREATPAPEARPRQH